MNEAPLDTIEAAKSRSTSQRLFKAARLLNERALATLRQRTGHDRLRPAHTSLFPHIDLDGGTRLTTLAARVGISKQAVGQLVDELVAMGSLERVPDPDDGRAKRIRFSLDPELGILGGLAMLGEIEDALAEHLGRPALDQLHATLGALLELLEADPGAPLV